MRALTRDSVIKLLRKTQGNRQQNELARELGVSPAYLCDVYSGKREPGPAILQHFGLVRRVVYERA